MLNKKLLFVIPLFVAIGAASIISISAATSTVSVTKYIADDYLVETGSGSSGSYLEFKQVPTTIPDTPTPPPVSDHPCPNSLGQKAKAKGVTIGFAFADNLFTNQTYVNAGACHFDGVVAENLMKTTALNYPLGNFTWGEADKLLSFADATGKQVRGHTLIWFQDYSGAKPFRDGLPCERNAWLDAMKTHITTVINKYEGRVDQWDVVNEALADGDSGKLRGEVKTDEFYQCVGPDYIEKAFEYARATGTKSKLYYNDYAIEMTGAKNQATVNLANSLKAKELIDGIGIQSHVWSGAVNQSDYKAALTNLASTGLDIAITEADFNMPRSNYNYAQQAKDYSFALQVCLDLANCNDFYVWGLDDGHSWYNFEPFSSYGRDNALLLDRSYQPKPAYDALVQTIEAYQR